jgi:pyroglutamyl-peptidase
MTASPRLLLTGFGPFPGAPRNPTAEVVARLATGDALRRLGVEIVPHVFDTTWGALDALPDVVAATRPDIVLHLGLKRRARAIAVEAFGRNRVLRAAVDAAGVAAATSMLDPAGPQRRAATLRVGRLRARIAALGLPAEVSHDAGRYLCNALLYRSLGLGCRPTGFLHLPPTRDLVGLARSRFTLPDLVDATAAAIAAIA